MTANLLLLSNSTVPGHNYLEHARNAILEVLGDITTVVFIPFALADHDAYTNTVRKALEPLGITVTGAHQDGLPSDRVAEAEAIFVGGGNTFRLVKAIHDKGLLEIVRARARDGVPYIGSSAGTNVAAPTLRTTNDMPIVQPPSFETFGLVPFQINPHYLDPDPRSTHQGETREQRLTQFLEENNVPVLGMREGTWLRVQGDAMQLGGPAPSARIFCRGSEPTEVAGPSDVTWLTEQVGSFDDPASP